MKLYAESSAVLSWLLDEPTGDAAGACLAAAEWVVTSELTLLEVRRSLERGRASGRLDDDASARARADLAEASAGWAVIRIVPELLDRAGRSFPVEPVRTLDALHLASALAVRDGTPDLAILSLDQRIRDNAREMRFPLVPGIAG
ncbi:MAG TPA: type II toxin-antitoxin system VapC family toxin [Thermoanaerobaculia bacterium]|nr:type II toxin-antitoxin system VapC family toxin [Thermoanaerobaculia bacterium]